MVADSSVVACTLQCCFGNDHQEVTNPAHMSFSGSAWPHLVNNDGMCFRVPGVFRGVQNSGAGEDDAEPGEHRLPPGTLQQGEEEGVSIYQ